MTLSDLSSRLRPFRGPSLLIIVGDFRILERVEAKLNLKMLFSFFLEQHFFYTFEK